jgi:hypothetical protein
MTSTQTKPQFLDRRELIEALTSIGKAPARWEPRSVLLAQVERHAPGFTNSAPTSAATHRETVLAKLQTLPKPGPTNSAAPTSADAIAAARAVGKDLDQKRDELAELGRKTAALNAKLDGLLAKLSQLQKSKAPAAAVARQAETITRKAAAELGATRRETGTLTAAEYQATQAGPTMCRVEFAKLTHPQRNAFIRSGGKLV